MRLAGLRIMSLSIAAAIAVVAGTTARVHGIVVTLPAAHDNTLFQSETGALSSGSGTHFYAGETARALVRRSLLSFNVASAIPQGAAINSVTLTLHVSQTAAGPQPFTLHRVLSAWGEGASAATSGGGGGGGGGGAPAAPGDATWIHRFFPGTFWSSPGGDFSATASAGQRIGAAGFWTFSSPHMADDVQQWLDHPAGNFGWLIRGDESTYQTTKRFDSRENPTASFRPALMIDYTAIPADLNGDGTVNSLDLGILLSGWSIPTTAPACAGADPCPADINHDGSINSLDLGILLSSWTLT